MQASSIVTLHLYTTSSIGSARDLNISKPAPTPDPMPASDDEAQLSFSTPVSPTTVEKQDLSVDIEKAPTITTSATLTESTDLGTPWDSTSTLNTTYGRPDVNNLIRDVVSKAQNGDRIIVAACGPPGMMGAVRSTTASVIRTTGPKVELHCEAFGW